MYKLIKDLSAAASICILHKSIPLLLIAKRIHLTPKDPIPPTELQIVLFNSVQTEFHLIMECPP